MCLRLFTFIHVNLLYCIVLYCSARTDTHPHGDFVGYLARRTAGTAMSNCWQTSGPNGWWEMGGWTTSIYCAPEGGLSVVKRGTPLWARVFLFYEKCVIKLILNFAWLSFFFLFFFCPRTTFHPHGTVSTLWSCRCHAHQRPVITLSLWRPVVLTSRRHRRHRRPPTTEDTQIVSPDGFDISSSKRSKLNRKPDNMHFPQRLPSRFRIQWDGATRMGGWGFQRIQYIDIVFEQLNLNV